MMAAICRGLSVGILLFSASTLLGASTYTELSTEELRGVESRVRRFYANPKDPAPMLEAVPKYRVGDNRLVHPNQFLRLSSGTPKNPMLRLAQAKGTEAYRKWYCKNFLEKHFDYSCDPTLSWSSFEENDRVERLAVSWMNREDIVYDLDQVPTSGATELTLWSDDYWRTQWGGLSYRYQEGKTFSHYRDAVADYQQPREWSLVVQNPVANLISEVVSRWSPAEKYDIALGDDKLTLTLQQKEEGELMAGGGNVEGWVGICHGWAAAAIAAPKSMKPVTTLSKRGVKVVWHPHDVRSLASLAWAKGTSQNNYAGGRCRPRDPQLYSNGRIVDPECFDSNPATFHLALGNLIGKAKASFIMDKAFDYEVWNQPIHSYQFTYFNPLNPGQHSKNWRDVAVEYDATFKATDRFQTPNTRGIRAVPPDDGRIKKIVGVIAVVVYLAEVHPRAGEVMPDLLHRATYTYDLEMEDANGAFVPRGGEWHENAHPDFLWVPRKGEIAVTVHDKQPFTYAIAEAPAPAATTAAQAASAQGYPLCGVIKELVNNSAEPTGSYACPVVQP